MSDNLIDSSTTETQSTNNDALQPLPSRTTTVKNTANNYYNSMYRPGEVYYLYPHHYPPYHTSTASGVSMRGRRRPVGVSGRGGVSAASNPIMPPRTNTSCRGGGATKRVLLKPVKLQHTPSDIDKEENDLLVQQTPPKKLEIEEEEEEEEEEEDDEYKEEEESDDDGEDEKEEEEVKDEASSSISNILVDHNHDELDILEELRDLLEDYEDDWTMFASHISGIESSVECKTTESQEKNIYVTDSKDASASASSPLKFEENHRQTDIEHKEKYLDPNDACAASTLSTTSSLDTVERQPLSFVHSNINTAASSKNKHNYPSLSAPPSPTIHNSTFRCPLDFIRHPQLNQPANASNSNQPQRQEDTDHSTAISEPTQKQLEQLTHLLDQFYQALLQQAVITVRHLYLQKQHAIGQDPRVLLMETATKHSQQPQRFTNEGSENLTQDELAEILDGAVGMLQELDALRKNALRNIVTFEEQQTALDSSPSSTLVDNNQIHSTTSLRRVLTRSLFMRTLQERYSQQNCQKLHQNASIRIRGFPTVFDIRGLSKLEDTFKVMDESVVAYKNTLSTSTTPSQKIVNILHPRQHGEACELLLQYSDAAIDTRLIPGKIEISRLFTDPQVLFENNQLDTSKIAESFTYSEDILIVKGVNVFGEKAWPSISQRFLPDRPTRAISHRYTKLCILMYKACGVFVNDITGDLACDVDGDIGHLTPVTAPAKFNVNRWSFEEDILLLKAVPILGRSWAEINSKWIKHRTRGHLRKRYQVLERRIKAGVKREASDNKSIIIGKQSKKSSAASDTATASSFTLNPPFPKIKLGEKMGPDSTAGKRPSRKNSRAKTCHTEVLTAHHSMMPIAESKASYHPYPYYGTPPYYYPYFFPPHYPPGAINFCIGSAAEKSTETPSFSTVSKTHTVVNDTAKRDLAVPADNRGNKFDIHPQQNQANIHAESDAVIATFDPKTKNSKLISGASTVDHKMKKDELLSQNIKTKKDAGIFSCTDALETTMDLKTKNSKLISNASTVDHKMKKDEVLSQNIKTKKDADIFSCTVAVERTMDPKMKNSKLISGALIVDNIMKKNKDNDVFSCTDAVETAIDPKMKNSKLISAALTVDNIIEKNKDNDVFSCPDAVETAIDPKTQNEVVTQDIKTKKDKDVLLCSNATETTMNKSNSQNNQIIDRTDLKTSSEALHSVNEKGGDSKMKTSDVFIGALTLDPKIKKKEAHSQHNQTSVNKKACTDTDMKDSRLKKRKIRSQHNQTIYKEVISARMPTLHTVNDKGGIISKHGGYSEILSESGKISKSPTKCLGVCSLNISNVEHMLLCYENKECTKMSPGVRFRTSSEDDRSLLCYENDETLVKPLHNKMESSDLTSSASKRDDSPRASNSPDRLCILPFIENETPSQLIDIPTQMMDMLDGEEASHIGIEKIIAENETKCHSSVSFARLAGSKKSGILNSGRDLTRTSTNFDDVRNALMQGADEVTQLPQFTLEASGLSFLGPFEYNGKSCHHDGNICDTKSIYAKVLERATNKLPSDPQNDRMLTPDEKEVERGYPLSKSLMTAQIYSDKEVNESNYPQCFDTTFANLTNDPPISLPSAYIGDIEFNDFACGEKTRDALELNSNSDRLQASIGFTYPESLDQYPALSFERFDPVSALKSLGHPVSPARSSNLIGSTTLKRPRQSLFASAVSAVQEKDEKKMKASKGAES